MFRESADPPRMWVMIGQNISQNPIKFLNRIGRFRHRINVFGGSQRLEANSVEGDRMGYLGKNSLRRSNLASYPKLVPWESGIREGNGARAYRKTGRRISQT